MVKIFNLVFIIYIISSLFCQFYLNLLGNSMIEKDREIEKLRANQSAMWNAFGELVEITKSNSKKLDSILMKMDQMQTYKDGSSTEELQEMLNKLPVGMEDFKKFNENIQGNINFKRSLVCTFISNLFIKCRDENTNRLSFMFVGKRYFGHKSSDNSIILFGK